MVVGVGRRRCVGGGVGEARRRMRCVAGGASSWVGPSSKEKPEGRWSKNHAASIYDHVWSMPREDWRERWENGLRGQCI